MRGAGLPWTFARVAAHSTSFFSVLSEIAEAFGGAIQIIRWPREIRRNKAGFEFKSMASGLALCAKMAARFASDSAPGR